MAALYAGLYLRLKDRDTPMKDKVKLTRFAWKSDKAFIPNKEQVLIDYLCGLLVNKKRFKVSDDDSVLIWKCLYDILHTNKAHQPSKYGKTIIIKPSICQVLIGAISSESRGNKDCYVSGLVIGCCYAIISSPCLSYVFTSKYENMVGLLSALIQQTIGYVTSDRAVPQELGDLMEKMVHLYKGSQRAHPNQKQVLHVVTTRLLAPAVVLWGCTRPGGGQTGQCAEALVNIIQNGLFNKDHQVSYNMYLSIACGEGETKSQPPKVIENLFTVISNVLSGKLPVKLTSDDKMKTYMLSYLPYFFNGFIHHKCNSDDITAHRLFLYICSLIGVKLGDSGSPMEQTLAPPTLGVVSGLLRLVHEADIYNVASDNAAGAQQLQAYRALLDIVLRSKECPEVFACFHQLLHLNHMILEPRITEVLALCLQPKHHESTSSDELMGNLASTYSKLRQVPKLMEKLLATMEQCSFATWSGFSDIFSERLGEVVQSLPQGTTVDIWGNLLAVISDKYIPQLSTDSDNVWGGRLVCMADLVQLYLKNIRIADYSITDMTSDKVTDLMVAMETKLLVPLLDLCLERKKSPCLLLGTLYLCWTWGELDLLLRVYTKRRSDYQLTDPVGTDSPGLLHTYWSADNWTKLQKTVLKGSQMDVRYCLDLLTHQILRATLLSISVTSRDSTPLLTKVLDRFFSSPGNKVSSGHAWDGKVFSVTEENYSTAKWGLLETALPIVTRYLGDSHVGLIADLVVQLYLTDDTSSNRCTITSVSDRIMKGFVLKQSREIQSTILTSLWKSVGDLLQPKLQSGKKKKSKLLMAHQILEGLGDMGHTWTQDMDSMKLEYLQGLTVRVGDLLTDDGNLSVSAPIFLDRMLQLLALLPIETLNATDRFRCILGLTVMLHVLCGCVNDGAEDPGTSHMTGVMERCAGLLSVTMDTGLHTPVFQMLDLVTYLEWLDGVYMRSQSRPAVLMKIRLLLEMSCRAIVKDYKAVGMLQAYIKKVHEKMKQFVKKGDKNCGSLDGCLIIVSLCLEQLEQMHRKLRIPSEVRETCHACLLDLISVTMKFVSSMKTDLTEMPLAVVSCYATTLKCSSFEDEITDVEKKVQRNFVVMLNWSMAVLQQEEATPASQSEALNLLSVICCSHRNWTEMFTPDHKAQVWDILMALLQRILDSKKTDSAASVGCVAMDTDTVTSEGGVAMETDSISTDGTESTELSLTNWRAHRRVLLYSGQLAVKWTPVIVTQIQETLAAVVASCDTEQFQAVVNKLLDKTSIDYVGSGTQQLTCSLYVWQQLLKFDLSADQGTVIVPAVQNLLLNCESLMQHVHSTEDEGLVVCLAVPILTTQVCMLAYGRQLMSPHTASLPLHCCQFMPLDGSTSFVPAFHAVYEVLNALLVHHTNMVYGVIPSFLSAAKRLLKALINRGDQERLSQSKDATDKLIGCALLFDRLCQLISTHKVDFNKVAGYLVADYVCEVQKVTLHPEVKKTLVPAIYKLLDLCDRFSISQLHTVLNMGVREVFKVLYSDYTKYFKYQGTT